MNKEEKTTKLLVAVYGTLRKDSGNHVILKNSPTARLLGEHTTDPKFTMLHLGGFPGVIETGNTPIITEIYSVEDNYTKRRLDSLEGYTKGREDHNLYNKTTIKTKFGDATMYIYNASRREIAPEMLEKMTIKTGDWYNQK